MKFTLPSLNFLANAWSQAIARFPLAILVAMVGTIAWWMTIEPYADQSFKRIIMVSQIGVAALVAAQIFGESRQFKGLQLWILPLITLGLLGLYFWYLNPKSVEFQNVELPRYLVLLVVAHLSVTFAPFIGQRDTVADFWEFNKQIFANWLAGAFYGCIIFIGLSAAIAATNQLFDLHMNYRIYPRLFFVLAGIFHPAYFLYHFPKDFHFDSHEIKFSKTFLNLCKYILIPIIGLYFIILYAFSTKILLTWNLPRGWVASLVLGFAGAGIFTWLLNFMLPQIDSGTIVNRFKQWFWWILAPMLFLLFISIAHRIMDYGVTEPRFIVAHLGSWLLLCTIFFVFIKSEDIKFIPLSLAAFLLVGTYGPFSAFASSLRSQKKELQKIMEMTGRWEAGKLVPNAAPVSDSLARRVYSILDFFDSRNQWQAIKDKLPDTMQNKGTHMVLDYLNIGINDNYRDSERKNFYAPIGDSLLRIEGYSRFMAIHHYDNSYGDNSLIEKGTQLKLNISGINQNFDLQPLIKRYSTLKDENIDGGNVSTDNATFVLKNESYEIKVFVSNIVIDFSNQQPAVQSLDGFVFVR